MSGDDFVRAAARCLLAGLLAAAGRPVCAEPLPESLFSPPDDLLYGFADSDLVRGFALDASGNVVPAAYLRAWSQSRQAAVLWVTDGTVAGTHPASPDVVSNEGGTLFASHALGAFFIGHDEQHGWQIHRTDGPENSARVLTNVPEGVASIIGVIDGKPVFSTMLADHSAELFAVDPDTGTVSDLGHAPGAYPQTFATNQVVFAVGQPVPPQTGYNVTAFAQGNGPIALPVPPPNIEWDYPHRLGGGPGLMCAKAYTQYPPTSIAELYCSDGTAAGTRRPLPSGLGMRLLDNVEFYPMGDRVLFQGLLNNVAPLRLWSTDGTDAGTQPLTQPGVEAGLPCTEGTSGAYFTMSDHGGESGQYRKFIARTDGTTAGTRTLIPVPIDAGICNAIGVEGASGIAYLPVGTALYRSDGTPAGTYPIGGAPLLARYWSTRGHDMGILGRWLVFVGLDAAERGVLWRLDLDPIFTNGFDGP